MATELMTRKGVLSLPFYAPVITFGDKYPLDKLILPYLPRLANAVMVSYYYAKLATPEQLPRIPLLVDSGGFVSLFEQAEVIPQSQWGVISIQGEQGEERITPKLVLELQEQIADVAFTLDFPIPVGMDEAIAHSRLDLTIKNAGWAINNRRRRDLPLLACIQGWDVDSYVSCAKSYRGMVFDGFAIGGLVPRSRDEALIIKIVEAVRYEVGDVPLHVFGLGHPKIIEQLFKFNVSVDSSSYVRAAATGKFWGNSAFCIEDLSVADRLHLALCNLAIATGKSMPMSTRSPVFSTLLIK